MIGDEVQAKMELAIVDLERQLRAANRVMIGSPWWEPATEDEEGNLVMHLACDSVPSGVVKILGPDKVMESYLEALRHLTPDERRLRGIQA